MKQEDKELLLKDIYARIPYQVKCRCAWEPSTDDDDYEDGEGIITGIIDKETILVDGMECYIEDIKPYLRPLLSMTKEEKKIILCFMYGGNSIPYKEIDYYNQHHFDYRGLIERGLVLEAPKDMYK